MSNWYSWIADRPPGKSHKASSVACLIAWLLLGACISEMLGGQVVRTWESWLSEIFRWSHAAEAAIVREGSSNANVVVSFQKPEACMRAAIGIGSIMAMIDAWMRIQGG